MIVELPGDRYPKLIEELNRRGVVTNVSRETPENLSKPVRIEIVFEYADTE